MIKSIAEKRNVASIRELDEFISEMDKMISLLTDDGWIMHQRLITYLGESTFLLTYVLEDPVESISDGPDLIRQAFPGLKFSRHEARILHGRGIDATGFDSMTAEELAERLSTVRSRKVAARLVSKRLLHEAQQHYSENDAQAWEYTFRTFLANVLKRAKVPVVYVLSPFTTDDDLKVIPGIGKKFVQQLINLRGQGVHPSELGR